MSAQKTSCGRLPGYVNSRSPTGGGDAEGREPDGRGAGRRHKTSRRCRRARRTRCGATVEFVSQLFDIAGF